MSKADADLYIFLCEEGNLSLSAFCAPHNILPSSRVVHVTGTKFGGISGSIVAINAPFPIHFDAVVCLQQHQHVGSFQAGQGMAVQLELNIIFGRFTKSY